MIYRTTRAIAGAGRLLLGVLAIGLILTATAQASESRIGDWRLRCSGQGCSAQLPGSVVQPIFMADRQGQRSAVFRVDMRAKAGDPVLLMTESGWAAPMRVSRCNSRFCEVVVSTKQIDALIDGMSGSRWGAVVYQVGGAMMIGRLPLQSFPQVIAALAT